ncbi:hypothetical protein RB195_011923 [Necator americanus]|uniref:ATP-dependent RNA helicase n=1 Tax=Necator americanus TaxID=51031 RepID=A0ABR1D4N4_NECAM
MESSKKKQSSKEKLRLGRKRKVSSDLTSEDSSDDEEATRLVPWTLDFDDDASSSDLDKKAGSLRITERTKLLDTGNGTKSTDAVDDTESLDSDDKDETEHVDDEEFAGSDEVEDMDLGDTTKNPEEDDYQKEFKILGQTEFEPLKKINVTTSWVSNATLFPAEIIKENVAELSYVSGLPEPVEKLVKEKIKSWFPVQKAVLPFLVKDIVDVPVIRPRDLAISAPTGSGKTLCYVLPILAQIGTRPRGRLQALVVVPVQTLVKQIEQEFNTYNACGVIITALSGATEFRKEQRQLAPEGVCISDVIISTPSRLMDHLTNPQSGIKLNSLRFLVVDEADRMGPWVRQEWLGVVERRSGGLTRATCLADILATRWAPRKILLSATLSRDVEELHMWNLHQPILFRADDSTNKADVNLQPSDHISGSLSLPSSIHHTVLAVEQKFHPLILYLKIMENDWKKVLVFTNEKESSLRLSILISHLAKSQFTVEQLTGDLFGNRRAKVLKRFKNGTTRVLICSDVLSRGVDVDAVDCVVNYDLPKNDRLFVHRAGRTGRAGNTGYVLSLAEGEARKIFVKNVLRKNGLWVNSEEVVIENEVLEPHLNRYKEALGHLKKTFEKKNATGKKNKVSGFAYRKKSRYQAIKEKIKLRAKKK